MQSYENINKDSVLSICYLTRKLLYTSNNNTTLLDSNNDYPFLLHNANDYPLIFPYYPHRQFVELYKQNPPCLPSFYLNVHKTNGNRLRVELQQNSHIPNCTPYWLPPIACGIHRSTFDLWNINACMKLSSLSNRMPTHTKSR